MAAGGGPPDGLAALRAGAQLLHRLERLAPVELVRRLGAVQAQDLRAFPLALRARTEGLEAATVSEAPGLVRTWLMRGTLHLVPEEDAGWMRSLLAPRGAAMSRRRLGQLGFSEDDAHRAVGLVREALPCTRADVGAVLERHGLPCIGQAPVHALFRAAAEGVLVLGLDDRVLPAPAPGRAPDDPAAELARRHLASRAPARPEDFASWSGLPVGVARAAWRELDLVELCNGWALRGREPEPVRRDLVRLLPAFDELLLGWKGPRHAVAPEHAKDVLPGGGMLRATVTVGGRAVGTWTRAGVELWEPVDPAALESELTEIRAWTISRPGRSPGDRAASS